MSGEFGNGEKIGDEISVALAGTSKTVTGTVVELSGTDSVASGKRRMRISFRKDAAKIGERVAASFGSRSEEGIVIPVSAIMTRYSSPTVFVVESGKARSKAVKILARSEREALVTGLEPGTEIVTEGKEKITE